MKAKPTIEEKRTNELLKLKLPENLVDEIIIVYDSYKRSASRYDKKEAVTQRYGREALPEKAA